VSNCASVQAVPRSFRALALSAAALAALSVAACSSSSGSSSGPPPSKAKLQAALLKSGDLPGSWKSTPNSPPQTDAAEQAKLAKCVGAKNTAPDTHAQATSPQFSQGSVQLSSAAMSFSSSSDVNSDISLLHSSKIDSCYEKLASGAIGGSLPAGTQLTSTQFHMDTSPSGPSNEVASATAKIVVKSSGQTATIYVSLAFLTGDRTEAQVQAESIGKPVPAAAFTAATKAVAGRINSL
jgi:hypothetical protein